MTARYKSLDIFRGLTIALMILVNTPGSWAYIYPPLQHADWHGYTPTDLVFPFFLIAVGLSMSFSFKKFNELNPGPFYLKVIKRTSLIFLIGLALTAFPFIGKNYAHLRIFGVLQRIALAYFFAALLIRWLRKDSLLLISSILILLAYWPTLYFFGGEYPYSLEGNLARKIDLLIIGKDHMWHGKDIAFDPEGLLSTLPSVVSVISGYLFGKLIQYLKPSVLVGRIIILGIGLIIGGHVWGVFFPINKSLWTSSYVLVSSGIAALLLSVLIYLIDVRKLNGWTKPFEVFGLNPLVSFIASILWVKFYFLIKINSTSTYSWLYNEIFKHILNPTFGSLIFAMVHVVGCWLIAYILYRKNIIVKV